MDAFILHAEGDEAFAQEMALRIAPSTSLDAPLASASAFRFGEHLIALGLWSARAEAQGLARQLTDLARDVGDRCIIVRLDGTPLPALVGTAQIAVFNGPVNDFAAILKIARHRACPTQAAAAPRSSRMIGGIGPGVGVGLAIYAGMFVAAGAWRSEEITEAMDTGKEVPATIALRSFQTAFDAPETAHISVASTEPSARFVQPQRVIATAAVDSSSRYPILTAKADVNAAELDRVDDAAAPAKPKPAPVIERTSLLPVAPAPTPDLSDAGGLSLIALDGVSTVDLAPSEAF